MLFFAHGCEPLVFPFFQFLFLAVQIRHPFGKRLVSRHEFVFATQGVDFFMGKLFLPGRHIMASVRRKSASVNIRKKLKL